MFFVIVLSLDNHLRLGSIGGIAIEVSPAHNPPLALPPAVPPGHQRHIARIGPNMREADIDKARNKTGNPLISLQL